MQNANTVWRASQHRWTNGPTFSTQVKDGRSQAIASSCIVCARAVLPGLEGEDGTSCFHVGAKGQVTVLGGARDAPRVGRGAVIVGVVGSGRVGILHTAAPEEVTDVRQVFDFYLVKADDPARKIDTDSEANDFIGATFQFVLATKTLF